MADTRVDRRTFAKLVGSAIGVAVALERAGRAGAQVPVPAPAERPAAGQQRQEQEPSATARALAEVLRERFGNRFTHEQYQTFTRSIESHVRQSATLRQQLVTNGDEPAFVFRPYRGRP